MDNPLTISPAEFKRLLDMRAVDFIFDLRNSDEFKAWRIEGKSEIETLNIPQTDFVGEEERHLARLPKGRRIFTICAHGDSSRYSAGLLRDFGFDAVSLEGGMDSWSDFYESHRVTEAPDIYQIYRTARGCISHIVVSGGMAAVIDPTRHVGQFIAAASSLGVRVSCVIDTHLHADHISGGVELAGLTGAPYYVHPLDSAGAAYDFLPLYDGLVIGLGQSSIEAIHSPGHTPGSTSLLLDGRVLFSGDTIMKTSVGRPDLGGKADEWAVLLYGTLFERYVRLPDSTVVLPAHSESIREQDERGRVSFALGTARLERDLFQLRDVKDFVGQVNASLPENPVRYQEIRRVNLGLVSPDEAGRKELEIGKNLCGMTAARA